MLGNCDFLICRTGKETAIIDSTTKQEQLRDSEHKQVTLQQITSIEMVRIPNTKEDRLEPLDREILNDKAMVAQFADLIEEDKHQI